MGLFDAPAIAIRKRIPLQNQPQFNAVEVFAQSHLRLERDRTRPYQLGIVLAVWTKAGIMAGEITVSIKDATKIQAISDSCVKVIGSDSYAAFRILALVAQEDGTFGVPVEIFERIAFDAAAHR